MSLPFTDEEFQLAWKELDEPQLDGGWELFTEAMGVKIYRLFDQVPQPQQWQPEASGWFSNAREKDTVLASSSRNVSGVTANNVTHLKMSTVRGEIQEKEKRRIEKKK